MPELSVKKDWRSRAAAHYSKLYRQLAPPEVESRCKLSFEGGAFSLRLMGEDCRAEFPDFVLRRAGEPVRDEGARVLILRYLCAGRMTPSSGKQLSYNDIPWGSLYYSSFDGRCLKRIERLFGADTRGFSRIFEENKKLKAEKLAGKDCAWRFEFLNGLFMSVIIWEGDEDFPSKAQVLFDDNFPAAFSAEDTAAACDICVSRLKEMKDRHE
ncbi:MAG: DUF3786 domain-containing protein [Spirochaetaceae bacterium]|jgi:hypothetical protein|nr:DUF3786 domain-containing protein [Spirochaetaceae bacterium]